MRPGQPARTSHDYTRAAPHLCLPLSISPPDGLSASAMGATAPRSSASSSTRSKPPCRATSMFTLSWTTTPRTKPRSAKRPRRHVHLTPTSSSWLNPGRAPLCAPNRKKDQTRHLPKCRRLRGDIAPSSNAMTRSQAHHPNFGSGAASTIGGATRLFIRACSWCSISSR